MKPPTKLAKESRAVWRETLAKNPHLGEADKPLLELYCRLAVQLDQALAEVETNGRYAVSAKGSSYVSPAVNVAFGLTERLVRLARELKVTFSSRPVSDRESKVSDRGRSKNAVAAVRRFSVA